MGFTLKYWKNDLPAGLIVFLVAVPLCLGIALASGAPLFGGIIAGVCGGIVVSIFSGSQLGVSGPAAGLAVIVYTAIVDTFAGNYKVFLVAVVIAGGIQFLAGVLRLGVVAYYFPSSVIKGMLAAIGIILILKQLPLAVGYASDVKLKLWELHTKTDLISVGAIVVAVVSLAILILWEQAFMKKQKIFQLIQGPLVAVVSGIILGYVFQDQLTAKHMVAIPVASNMSEVVGLFTLPDFSVLGSFDVEMYKKIFTVAFTLAIVASIETLLCLEATDKLDPDKRVSPSNMELRAQGIGNLASGLIGGLPVTQVIVRSSANINSGGRTKLSALVHGIILLAAAVAFPGLINRIPLACLAAILLVVGYKLARISLFKAMYKKGISQFLPFIVTVIAIVAIDLLMGIGIGMAVAFFFILFNNYKLPFHRDERDVDGRKEYTLTLSEEVSFLNRGRIMHTLDEIPHGSRLVLDRTRVMTIDPDVEEVIENYKAHAQTIGVDIEIRTQGNEPEVLIAKAPEEEAA